MRIRHGAAVLAAATAMLVWAGDAGATATQGQLYHDGEIVGTVVNAGRLPNGGVDPFYAVTNGVTEQLGIAGVAPGDPAYRGGAWAVSTVTFVDGVEPYLLTSDEAVFEAEAAGDVEIVRTPSADFRCPVTAP